jgi:hypothetical protein
MRSDTRLDPQNAGAPYRSLIGIPNLNGRCLHQIMSAKTKVTKTKTALKQETAYNLSDPGLKHDLHCGFVELGGSVSVSS